MSAPAFDPFTATFEEAAAQPDADQLRDGGGAIWKWTGAHFLLEGREFYEGSPLDGMAVCATYNVVAPDWLAKAYLRCFRDVRWARVDRWSDAFGPERRGQRPGQHLSSLRLQYSFRLRVEKLFTGPARLPRTYAGRQAAAQMLGITEKQVRALLAKTRVNVRGHKPYSVESTGAAPAAHDPFSLTRKRVPNS